MSMNQLIEISKTEPVVHEYLQLHMYKGLEIEDAMFKMIESLIAQKNQHFDELVKYKQRYGELK